MESMTFDQWRAASGALAPDPLPQGVDAAWHGCLGRMRLLRHRYARYQTRAEAILARESSWADLSGEALDAACQDLRACFCLSRPQAPLIDDALGVLREVTFRTLGLRHHAVQLAGAMGLQDGVIVEMATGEGKSLTAALGAILAGWRGRGCHVMTVNDYLAQRDADELEPLFTRCGLRVKAVTQETDDPGRREAYRADITYCTNKEVAADFLRDRLKRGKSRRLGTLLMDELLGVSRGADSQPVLRGLECAIVDEADSVLIDEAVTPLLISGHGSASQNEPIVQAARRFAEGLQTAKDYTINETDQEIKLTAVGRARVQELSRGEGGIWNSARRAEELVTIALSAQHLFLEGRDYVVDDGKVVIVDGSTGRMMPDRTWRDGLHQAVEAKEGVEISPPQITLSRISFQRFFRLYKTIGGMTGTATEARNEFWQIYRTPVVRIPTHKPCRREILPTRVFRTQDEKWHAVVEQIARVHATGQPVLIGTRSVKDSLHLSRELEAKGFTHRVLNAVFHREEAQIIQEAGRLHAITVATNMAGRGTDIKLDPEAQARGGLFVIASDCYLTRRVDRQLIGRCARQGAAGQAQFLVSLDDELPVRFAWGLGRVLRWKWIRSDGALARRVGRVLFRLAQWQAQRLAFQQRRQLLQSDTWLDESLSFAGLE